MAAQWNPRWVAYAHAHGTTPGAALDAPCATLPRYVDWIGDRWSEWAQAEGPAELRRQRETDRRYVLHADAFDVWLARKVAT